MRAVQTVEEAVHCLTDWLQPGDRLLVKGSRIMQMDRIVETLLREPHE